MKNAIPKRSHRERAQPHNRSKRGILEKRKDYLLRAADYKRKQTTLKRLGEKASERNPDEFYFGMMRERTVNGVAIADRPGSKALGVDEIQPLKKQDGAYLRTMRSIERNKIERLRAQVPGGTTGKKIIFAEDENEGMSCKYSLTEAKELRLKPRDGVTFGGKSKSRDAKELEARIARDAELEKMERRTTLQVQLMGKGSARKIRRKDQDSDDESIPIYKWKPQRKK
jgi:U3 small nucleolar RNA-associated protein 11